MSALTSLLARDHVVPVRKIEEALSRQVLEGGEIETVLLEMGLVPEDVLSAYQAALYGLIPATREEVMRAPRDATRAISSHVAQKLRVLPISFDGKSLVVAAAEPPSAIVQRKLADAARAKLSVRIVNEPRLMAALSHHYGFELDKRFGRLVDKLRKRDPGTIVYVKPPAGGPIKPQPRDDSAHDDSVQVESARSHSSRPPRPDDGGAPDGVTFAVAKACRGPLVEERAQEVLAKCESREDVLYVLLRYAAQFFEFSAVFSVQKETARGRACRGAGVSTEMVRSVEVPLGGAGLLARAVRDKRPLVGMLSQAEGERRATMLLGRPAGCPGLCVPVVLGTRVVLVLYVDRDGEAVAPDDAAPLTKLLVPTAEALRRIIVTHKALGGARSSLLPPSHSVLPEDAQDEPVQLRGQPVARVPVVPHPESEPPAIESEPPEGEERPALSSSDFPSHVVTRRMGAPLPVGLPVIEDSSRPKPTMPLEELSALSLPFEGHHSSSPPREAAAHQEQAEDPERSDADGAAVAGGEAEALASDPVAEAAERADAAFPREDAAEEHSGAPTRVWEVPHDISGVSGGTLRGVPRAAPPPPATDSMPPAALPDAEARSMPSSLPPTEPELPAVDVPRASQAPVGSYSLHSSGGLRSERAGPASIAPPAPKSSLSAPAIPRFSSRAAANDSLGPLAYEPSIVIESGTQVAGLITDLMRTSPDEEPREIAKLLEIGEPALPELVQAFPGPLWFDRHQPHRRRPSATEISAVCRAIVAFGDMACPYVAALVRQGTGDVGFFALMVASELLCGDLVEPVARRVFDPDPDIAQLAIEVLRGFSYLPEFELVLNALSQLAAERQRPLRQQFALRALSQLGDSRAAPTLIDGLRCPTRAVARVAHEALVLLTCQDFGAEADDWKPWLAEWGDAHRVEWLLEGLLHADERIRSLAGAEIMRVTHQGFGYHPASPQRDREVVQRKYRDWWEREGRRAFAP